MLVSLSTTYVAGQSEVLQRIIEACAPLPVTTVVTAGPAVDVGTLTRATNTELHAYLPHAEVIAAASVLVGHGGHATTMLALAHGVPVLVVPTNPSFDQPGIGRLVAARGLGVTLPRTSGVDELRGAIHALLTEPRFRAAAADFARARRERPEAVALAADALVAAQPER